MPRILRGSQAWLRGPLRRGTEDGTNRVSRGNITLSVISAEGELIGLTVQSIPYSVGVVPAEGTLVGQPINLVRYVLDVVPAEGTLIGQSITLLP